MCTETEKGSGHLKLYPLPPFSVSSHLIHTYLSHFLYDKTNKLLKIISGIKIKQTKTVTK